MARLGILGAVTAAAAPIGQMLLATQGGATVLARLLPDTALLATRTSLQNALLVALGPDRLRLGCEVAGVASGRVTLASGDPLVCDLVVDAAGGILAPSSAGSAPPMRAMAGCWRSRAGSRGPGLEECGGGAPGASTSGSACSNCRTTAATGS